VSSSSYQDTTQTNTNTDTQNNTSSTLAISNVSVNPKEFAPTGTIYYTISKPAYVTLVVYNRSLIPVRTLESGVKKSAGSYSILWDGKDSQGFEVEDIVYSFKITAEDLSGLLESHAAGTINMSPATFSVNVVSASPLPYNPKGQAGGLNPLTITYSLSATAKVTASIYDSNGNLVKELFKDNLISSGTNTITWDGLDYRNARVTSGSYQIRITAKKDSGRQSQSTMDIVIKVK
jgi:flagellar hook assembly protein FlgD